MAEQGLVPLMKTLVRLLFSMLGGVAGYQTAQFAAEANWLPSLTLLQPVTWTVLCIVVFALLGFILAPLFWTGLRVFGQLFEKRLQNIKMYEIVVSLFGLILGLVVALLISLPLSMIPVVGDYLAVLMTITVGYLGVRLANWRRDDVWAMLTNIGELRGRLSLRRKGKRGEEIVVEEKSTSAEGTDVAVGVPKILDTSSLIDGRILDVAKTGFVGGTLILPRFILTELQGVADSTDPLRRTRGRRGMDVVTGLQQIGNIEVQITEETIKELGRDKVDEALVVLARRLGGYVVTTDYNLNQVARIEGVKVLNVNDLANALKPMFLPGEVVDVEIIREGKEVHQGIGYLDDGTMIVVEDGRRHIGEQIHVCVTSMLQTSAGRMVFARILKEGHA